MNDNSQRRRGNRTAPIDNKLTAGADRQQAVLSALREMCSRQGLSVEGLAIPSISQTGELFIRTSNFYRIEGYLKIVLREN